MIPDVPGHRRSRTTTRVGSGRAGAVRVLRTALILRQQRRAFDLLRWLFMGAFLGLVTVLAGCEGSGGTFPPNLRFGQVGSVQVDLVVPLRLGAGTLRQTLSWSSSGAWSLRESVEYRGLQGDETIRRNSGDPTPFAAPYASLITLIDGVEGLKLFVPAVSDTLSPECGLTGTRITLTITDEARNDQARWIRCTDGSLSNLTPVGAGPDAGAARVVSVAQLARNETVGQAVVSAYHGTVPFGTLARGEDTQANVIAPSYILDASAWASFWQAHSTGEPLPPVDFVEEMVVVASVGERGEAGDSVEVRRILQVDKGTLTYVFERVPGDFCSPAARAHVPFHVIVAPRTPEPFRFADVGLERVTCGV